jgi:AraC-like DNA-binding protein
LRFLFLVLVALDVIVVLLAERLIIPWGSIAIYYAHLTESAINLALILTAICAMVLIGRPALVDPFGDRKVVVIPPADKQATRKPDPAVASILRALREQRVYRDCELTVASLAAKLSMPQYRLRKVILEELGYRNFNALLHEYRLAEACQDLRDPAKTHVPILTIALTVGYASINPFNRAFRDALGMTPSAYRAQESAAIPTDS